MLNKKISKQGIIKETRISNIYFLFSSCWLVKLFLDPEDGGIIFLRNVGELLLDYSV
jgi:hypothetical protein